MSLFCDAPLVQSQTNLSTIFTDISELNESLVMNGHHQSPYPWTS